jgi:hypothetical protein
MSQLLTAVFINTILEDWRHAETMTFYASTPFVSISWISCTLTCTKEQVYPPVFRINYFNEESTLFEKSAETHPFS